MTDEQSNIATPEACSEALHSRDAAAQMLGISVVNVSLGKAELSMTIRADMLNGLQSCHGGMMFSLADTAFAHACNSANKATVASGCSIDFIAPAREGDVLTAYAEERSRGGRTGVYDIEIYNQDKQLVAIFRGQSYQLKGTVLSDQTMESKV